MANTRLFSGGGFGETYNDNRTLLLTPPSTGRAGAGALRFRKVELHFLLSGHGTMVRTQCCPCFLNVCQKRSLNLPRQARDVYPDPHSVCILAGVHALDAHLHCERQRFRLDVRGRRWHRSGLHEARPAGQGGAQ